MRTTVCGLVAASGALFLFLADVSGVTLPIWLTYVSGIAVVGGLATLGVVSQDANMASPKRNPCLTLKEIAHLDDITSRRSQ
jgi:hypothetical protein